MNLPLLSIAILAALAPAASMQSAPAEPPNCIGAERWPAGMAFTQLKNAGLLTNQGFDADATTVTRMASEQIAADLHRQIHKVRFKWNGSEIEVLTVSDASAQECSMGGVRVYVVSQVLGTGP